VTPRRRPLLVVATAVAVVVLGTAGVAAAGKVAGLDRLGTPVQQVTTDDPAPRPLPLDPAADPEDGGRPGWTVRADGRVTDVAVLPPLGEVIYVEELAHRSWRATAVDARTGAVRWRNARGHTAHIEAWTVTDAAVVLAYHHSASRLAWRTHHAASFEGLDPVSGKVLWTRHIYNLLGARPGDYAPTLASPADNVVYARTEFGVPNAVDTRTGRTLWEHPEVDDCRTDQVLAGPAGVAMSQRCPGGTERVELLNPRSGNAYWTTGISTSNLRLLAVGSSSVAVYRGGMAPEVIVLGPEGSYAGQFPCDCGDGRSLEGGSIGGTTFSGGPVGLIGVGGAVLVGGPFGLAGADGATGKILWQKAMPGGPVHRVLTQDDDAEVISGDGALLHVEPATGATRVVIPGGPGPVDPDAVVAAVGPYLAAGSGRGFAFTVQPG
jgi:outer membrane protein assembly factor BamB